MDVNSRLLSNAVWENIKSYILPIAPGGFNPIARRRVAGKLEGFKRRFGGQEIVLLAIRDTEAWEGWSVRPVLIDDLKKGADQVLKEGFQALNDGNLELADSKRHAYMSISGMTDSK